MVGKNVLNCKCKASHSDGVRVLYMNFIQQNPAFDVYKINPPTPVNGSDNVHTT